MSKTPTTFKLMLKKTKDAYDRDGVMLRPFVRKLVRDYKELRAEVDQLKKLLHT